MTQGFQPHRSRNANRDPREVILIICEGKETEPGYFKRLKTLYRFTHLHIDAGGTASDVESLIRRAERKCKSMELCDHVYIVCDGDALRGRKPLIPEYFVNGSRGKAKVHLAVTMPCFEYWLILHFDFTDAPLSTKQALERLQDYWPNYQKQEIVFREIDRDHIERARRHAQSIRDQDRRDERLYTDVDLLLDHLFIGT